MIGFQVGIAVLALEKIKQGSTNNTNERITRKNKTKLIEVNDQRNGSWKYRQRNNKECPWQTANRHKLRCSFCDNAVVVRYDLEDDQWRLFDRGKYSGHFLFCFCFVLQHRDTGTRHRHRDTDNWKSFPSLIKKMVKRIQDKRTREISLQGTKTWPEKNTKAKGKNPNTGSEFV